jgi:hypothetical protein
VYFIIENKKQVKVEKFVDAKAVEAPKASAQENLDKGLKPANDPQVPPPVASEPAPIADRAQAEREVVNIYKELYQTIPNKEELDFFVDYATSRKVTPQKLREIIETSAPTLQKTFYSRNYADTPDEIYGNENEIVEVFNELLGRNPDRRELYNFAKMMNSDANFTLDKLRQILIASEEFKRMERTQNNMVYVNLQSNVTDRQLTMQVTKMYVDVTGQEYVDEDTLKFLKRKFVEFNLNEKIMLEFIKNYVSNTPFKAPPTDPVPPKAKAGLTNSELEQLKKQLTEELAASAAANASAESKVAKSGDAASSSNAGKNQLPKEAFDGKTVITDSKIYNFFGTDPANKEVIESLLSDSLTENGNIDSAKLMDKIKTNSSCAYNINAAEADMLEKNKQELADYINNRNRSHLKNVCQRNRKYMNADENMVLFPEFKWSVPQAHPPVCMGGKAEFKPSVSQTALIGTLLPEAQDTSVGSILPVFPPV